MTFMAMTGQKNLAQGGLEMTKYIPNKQDEGIIHCFVCGNDTLDENKDFCSYECERYWKDYIKDLEYFEMQYFLRKEEADNA